MNEYNAIILQGGKLQALIMPEKPKSCKERNIPCCGATFSPYDFAWLLSKGFDLFGLIESGLALDLTQHP